MLSARKSWPFSISKTNPTLHSCLAPGISSCPAEIIVTGHYETTVSAKVYNEENEEYKWLMKKNMRKKNSSNSFKIENLYSLI